MDRARTRIAYRIFGVVQGVGFRPFAARMAREHEISGHVKNCGGYVEVLAEGREDDLRLFYRDLSSFFGVLRIEEMDAGSGEYHSFEIVESRAGDALPALISPDLPVCEDCLRELRDPENRRFRHPFISCAACGARYSVIREIPYDRERTSMDRFPLCPACAAEYGDISDRRHFAQTICCHECGPELRFGALRCDAALSAAVCTLRDGGVIAIKGVGGYHFAARPDCDAAISRLRALKARPDKPLAVMFRDMEAVRACCFVSEAEEALLTAAARPIVLLRRRRSAISPLVYGASDSLGAFLPYTGYQHLILDELGSLVLTSANRSGEPMVISDAAAQKIPCDGVLWHEREIVTPLDDSVAAVCAGDALLYRRARGYVPLPIRAERVSEQVFAAGGDLKAALGFSKGGNLYLSQYLGDLERAENLARWKRERVRMERLFAVSPRRAVCDLHPGYYSAQVCGTLGLPVKRLQHHFAHTLSVMAEFSQERAIGVSFDGTGYGTDGSVWGGEFLLCDRHDFRRLGHLSAFTMLGGDDAARDAKKCAAAALLSAGIEENVLQDARHPVIAAALRQGVNTVKTTSAGRLFDVVSALLGLCMENRFEGACGEAVERAARCAVSAAPIPLPLHDLGERFVIRTDALFDALLSGRDAAELALGFHVGLAQAVCDSAMWARARFGENTVALSGGVFQNRLLLELAVSKLKDAGFSVLWNRAVPLNDGGLALGQLYWSEEESTCASR